MELAINTFNEGLLMDTNPLIQGTKTLTDCLNGTLLTMNGNEMVLLNDMGNRRVNNAFLPSGYLPVGMKEYGGVIYVAAYNPITNKSLVGSFPSPLRKVDSEFGEENPLLGKFNFDTFFDLNNIYEDELLKINVLKADSFMIPITNDVSLRAGDKFSIYSPSLYSYYQDLISNFNNTLGGKIKSPKNKKYTLSIGILNSLNEFVDITKTLCRWNKNERIDYDSPVSDLYKFNDGYFIASEFDNSNLEETLADAKLIKTRLKLAINTYSYKLVGPMYMKIELNHPLNFNYNIFGNYDEENHSATIYIDGYLTYNCPDYIAPIEEEILESTDGNDEYLTFDEVIPNFTGFDLFCDQTFNGQIIYSKKDPVETEYEKSVYNPVTNLYTTKIRKKYTFINISESDTVLDFTLGVLANNIEKGYLQGLSVKDSLDLSLLGSGKIKVKGWKFYNNVSKELTLLTLTLDAYPEFGKSFQDLEIKFTNLADPTNVFSYPVEEIYNGRQTLTLDWGSDNEHFHYRGLYRVELSYKVSDNLNEIISVSDILEKASNLELRTTTFDSEGNKISPSIIESGANVSARWILITELFNDLYNSNVLDICALTDEDETFNEKLNITLDYNASVSIINNMEFINSIIEGNLISSSPGDISYTETKLYEFSCQENVSSKMKLSQAVPATLAGGSLEINNLNVDNLQEILDSIEYIGDDSRLLLVDPVEVVHDLNNKNKIFLKVNDLFVGSTSNAVGTVTKVFGKLSDVKDLLSPIGDMELSGNGQFCGVAANYKWGAGRNYLDIIYDARPRQPYSDNPEGSAPPTNGQHLQDVNEDYKDFKFREYQTDIFRIFNDKLSGKIFTELTVGWNTCFSGRLPKSNPSYSWDPEDWDKDNGDTVSVLGRRVLDTGETFIYPGPANPNDSDALKNLANHGIGIALNYPRRWWRATKDRWALLEDSREINMPLVYCIYKEKNGINNLFATNNENECKYNDLYSFNAEVKIDFKLKENININYYSIGNLKLNFELPLTISKFIICPQLLSSLDFLDEIHNLDNNISNIFFTDDGEPKFRDINGDTLKENKVYYLQSDGELIEFVYSESFYIETNTGNGNNLNYILYNGNTIGTPVFEYNAHGSGDDRTSINFSGILVVPASCYFNLSAIG